MPPSTGPTRSRRPPSGTARPRPISTGDGFLQTTSHRTLARFQHSLRGVEDYAHLRSLAEAEAARRPSQPHRMLHVIVPRIQAPVQAEDGRILTASSEMSRAEIDFCRACFAQFMDLVFTFTGGALRIEANEWIVEAPVTRLATPGKGVYWLTAPDALAADMDRLPRGAFDSIGVYYKMPAGVRPALHGGAVGQDHGVRGAAYWTLWIARWNEPPGPMNNTSIASLHEWLHNVSYYAHHNLGETTIPDCHAGEEYGYWDMDGGYPQWQAWNRDLMLRYTPRAFWRRLTSRSRLKFLPRFLAPPAPPAGRFYRWEEVGPDWMLRLPRLSIPQLRRMSALPDLSVELEQPAPNTHVVWGLRTTIGVGSPYHAGPLLDAPLRLDNILAFGRRREPTTPDQPHGGYGDAPLESLAWVRSLHAPRDRRDLLLIRPDIAPWVLPRLGRGAKAADRLLGYLHRHDPSEGQPINVLVASVDLGDPPPSDEVAAITPAGRPPT